MPRVDFIIPGVQKAGTTALFDHLGDVPGIALSTVKEVHFFDDESIDWARPDYRAYEAQFASVQGAVVGEATPIYLYWPNALERIAAYNPVMRLIVMLRDPVERAWSHWRKRTKVDFTPAAMPKWTGCSRVAAAVLLPRRLLESRPSTSQH